LKVDKAYIALAIAAIPVIILFTMGAGTFVVDIVEFLYPAYASIKAVETSGKDDDSMWLTYWIIFCLFKVLDRTTGMKARIHSI
jgi:receptor expression-enhancing protein 5/6